MLLVEDSPAQTRLVRELLGDRNYWTGQKTISLECVTTLAAALARLASGVIDVVLLDLTLPDSTGIETFTRLRRRYPEVGVIVFTGLTDEVLGDRLVYSGAQDYLVKDQISGPLLVRAIRHAIERHHSAQALLQQKLRLERASTAGQVALWEWDLNSDVVEWPSALAVFLGLPEGQLPLTMDTWRMMIHPDDAQRVEQQLEVHLADNACYDVVYRVRRGPADWAWWHDVGAAARDADGRPVRMAGACVNVTARKQAEEEREELVQQLQRALVEVKTLKGLIPICGHCKKIRDDRGYWNQLEEFIAKHSDATFSHGICPDCIEQFYPDYAKLRRLAPPPKPAAPPP